MTLPILLTGLLAATTVQDRVFAKTDSLMPSVGVGLLDRHDLMLSPGIRLDVTHFFDESVGLDYLHGAAFFTRDTAGARSIRDTTGYVPDRGRPRALLSVGGRYALAYGKLLIEHSTLAVHCSFELSAHLGGLWTSAGLAPAGDIGAALRISLARYLLVMIDYDLVLSVETASGRTAVGNLPALLIGTAL